MTQFRQGDVLLVAVDTIPRSVKEVPRDAGRVVLAYGEATGHAHAFTDEGVTLWETPATVKQPTRRFLHVVKPVRLFHEEHDTHHVPPEKYRVIRQREYVQERIRQVVD